jgi:hypothetical protein
LESICKNKVVIKAKLKVIQSKKPISTATAVPVITEENAKGNVLNRKAFNQ